MSHKRKQKQAKQSKRSNQRAALAHNRPRSMAQIAYDIVASTADALLSGDPVDAEIVASEVMASILNKRLQLAPDELAELPSSATAVIELLRDSFTSTGRLNDAALALVFAVWSMDLTDLELAGEAGKLCERLLDEGATRPDWASSVGAYAVTECWTLRDVWCGQQDIVIGYREVNGTEHTVSALCIQDAGFQIGEINVGLPIAQFVERVSSSLASDSAKDLTVLEQIPTEQAALLLDAALTATVRERAELLRTGEMGVAHLSLVKSRWARLAKPEPDAWDVWARSPLHSELDGLSQHELERRLWLSAERGAEPATTRAAVDELAEWVATSGACVWLGQFGPDQVEEFLLDHAGPGAYGDADLDSRIASTLAGVRAWARLTHAVLHLPDAALDAVLETVAELSDEFVAIARGAQAAEYEADS